MAQQAGNDEYDEQLQRDIAEACALSLEQKELDDYQRKIKYGKYNPEARSHRASHSPQPPARPTEEENLIFFPSTTTKPAEPTALEMLLNQTEMPIAPSVAATPIYGNPASTNMVIYTAPPQNEKVKLNKEGLHMLYNMRPPFRPMGMQPPYLTQIIPQMGYPIAPYSTLPIAGSASTVRPPPIGFQFGNNLEYSSAAMQPHVPQIPAGTSNSPSNNMIRMPSTSNGYNALGSHSNTLRVARPSSKVVTGGDLINLEPDISSSRVSVLEAFDPLLNGYDEDIDKQLDENIFTASEEYDAYDYLYNNGGGKPSTDPVYDAVNRLVKNNVPPNVPAIGWRFNASNLSMHDSSMDAVATTSSRSPSVSQPPPLPPRNLSANNTERLYPSLGERPRTFSRLYDVITDKRTVDPELLEFYDMVKDLRSRYSYDDEVTNAGHVIASKFNYYYAPETSIKILVYPELDALYPDFRAAESQGATLKGYGKPVPFTCDISTTVELVIGQALCSLEGKIFGSVKDYAVKSIGLSEWLSPSSKLSQLECVHNSLKVERDVQLGLFRKTDLNMKAIARTRRDDIRGAAVRPEEILPNERANTITYDSMMILIDTFEKEVDMLESATSELRSHSCSGVVQAVKHICALLGGIDTVDVVNATLELRRICDELPLSQQAAQIKQCCNKLRISVHEFLGFYSNAFCVDFCVQTSRYDLTPLFVQDMQNPVTVCISCLHRPLPEWRYDSYSIGVQIYYGTRPISVPIAEKCSNVTTGGLFPRLNFSSWIFFEKNQICTLPRESCLIFVLTGTQAADSSEPNTDGNTERQLVNTKLGWGAIQLFDFKREMICGWYLLSLWPPTDERLLGPAPARGCHPYPDTCPVLSIEVPSHGGPIRFEEPSGVPELAPSYDFNSLDANLQQELIDTAEQGYMGATERGEVLWEKRHYLHDRPVALAKVLHAAHSWDYASLIGLHALLDSWSSLAPLQALELLLPRYPDAKVREKAVEWISHLPNDELCDYLPQLLQALKHDTYEASAMARFLLRKCLESPRIAHHMYWLLMHSLPGDDPQNSIDDSSLANEIVASRITQARYYRRNQMMLRSLLVICGENLLARFLRQSMMCKSLAKTAEKVRESKESLRQKTLCECMAVVHQELEGKPTSLPLGPEMEVIGVNTRNCSYFNSNTLPLKISYIGPDVETLPAIFKAGDDLQQDMLTIQLIRIMNKMWLADGLDLKIITFNCVPTGYKKGMIEMINDAETLRKIQLEYGLTGPFQDRPIADWLSKQNPSQLEYQRAVKNFTVSAAGYCVATYILGICDRHNDNIMLKTSGHLFHIDFGKFLGDAQMIGNFKRDRTPFVLTADMAYVIKGDKNSTDFQYFVDLCCRAFNIIRKHGDLILHMLALMATAGISGVTPDTVKYVQNALLPTKSNPEAAAKFAEMIRTSVGSRFTRLNFFLHNVAQIRFTNANEDRGELLSFVPRKYTMQDDGRLKSVQVVRCQKHYDTEKYYTNILSVTRHGQPHPNHIFRSYKEFMELHERLCAAFPLAKLNSLESGFNFGRSNVKSVAERRLREINRFLRSLFNSADEIAHSDLVYTFFHPLLRDQQEAQLDVSKVKEPKQTSRVNANEVGQLKVSLQYRRGALTVMIHHAKGLPMLPGNQEPNTYVKCYLEPDNTKITKRKTKVVKKSCVPSYMETLEYRMPEEYIRSRTLLVTVWSHDTLQEKELLGGFEIDLRQHDVKKELIDWYRLGHIQRGHKNIGA